MDLHEYQAKARFAQYGIPVARGLVVETISEAEQAAVSLKLPVVVKAQVLIGGRGKAGGIRLCRSAEEVRNAASAIFGMEIRGHKVNTLLVDSAAKIESELYLAVINDRAKRQPLIMASASGGMEIEAVNRETPELILRHHIDPQIGLRDYQIVGTASDLKLPVKLWKPFLALTRGLYECFRGTDSTLCEVNPLAIVREGEELALCALDGKMSVDDNALFRHPGLEELRDFSAEPSGETQARKAGINYVKLDGQIGCMVNGAGLAMATMDLVGHFGGEYGIRPANFLDVSGGANAEQVATGLRIIMAEKKVSTVLINIFGGITRGDEVARGIIAALAEVPTMLPITIRLAGTNHEEGMLLLKEANFPNVEVAQSLQAAAMAAVDAARNC